MPEIKALPSVAEPRGTLMCPKCFCKACSCGRHKDICRPFRPVWGHLDSTSEYSHNYKSFPVTPTRKWMPSLDIPLPERRFSANTENREAFVPHELPPYFAVRRPGWIPNPGHFEGITTQRVDFPVWPNIEERPRSTRRAQWAGSKPKHGLPAPPGRFSSSTTTAEFFQPWALPPRPPPPTRIPLHTESPLSSTTTYTTSYPVHELPARPGGPLPEPRLPVTKFTETSTQRADYIAPPAMEREVGRGEPLYVSNRETRDFVTTTKENHGTKEAVKCTVLGYVGWDKERRPDGHVYAVGERRSKEAQLR